MIKFSSVHIAMLLSAVTLSLATTALADSRSLMTDTDLALLTGRATEKCSLTHKCGEDIHCHESEFAPKWCVSVVGLLDYECVDGPFDHCKREKRPNMCYNGYAFEKEEVDDECPVEDVCGFNTGPFGDAYSFCNQY